jgi:hypothetical protein
MESILTHLVHRFQAKVVRMAYLNVPRNIVFALSTHNMDGAWAHNSYFTSNGFGWPLKRSSIHIKKIMTGHEKGDLLIKVTA